MRRAHWLKPIIAGALTLAGYQAIAQSVPSITPPPKDGAAAVRSSLGPGYLKSSVLAADVGLFPPPPAPGSAAEIRDQQAVAAAFALRGTPRWALATSDADIFGPNATRSLSCAAGVEIGAKTTPKLDKLLRRTLADFGLSTSAIKRKHKRVRPFMADNTGTCTPEAESVLRHDGSYPSGHSAIGYGWSLILADLLPDRAAQIVARGRAFGDSRRICNAHWLSDTEEGRTAGATTFARLQSVPQFRQDVEAVRAELAAVSAAPQGCDAEAAALQLVP